MNDSRGAHNKMLAKLRALLDTDERFELPATLRPENQKAPENLTHRLNEIEELLIGGKWTEIAELLEPCAGAAGFNRVKRGYDEDEVEEPDTDLNRARQEVIDELRKRDSDGRTGNSGG